MSLAKFHTLQQLETLLHTEKSRNKTISLASGAFNLIHIGHIRYLKAAAETADILVAALKGEDRGILDEKAGIRLLCSFYFVDYVILYNEPTLDNVLLTLKPDFYCLGPDYTEDTVPERETLQAYGGQIAVVGGEKIRSTSTIIEEIRKD